MAISKPITIPGGTLNTVLGCSSGDVGTICTWSSINMWSKRKPFRNSAWAFASDSEEASALRAANYGLSFPEATGSIIAVLAGEVQYLRPEGYPASPYRLLDFVGYEHSPSYATTPIMSPIDDEWNTAGSNTKTLSWTLRASTAAQIALSEFAIFDDYYPCLVVKNGTTYRMITLPNTFRNYTSALSFTLTYGSGPIGTHDRFDCYLVGHDTRVDAWTTPLSGEFIGLPFKPMSDCGISLKVYTSAIRVKCSATSSTHASETNWTITFTANVSSASSSEQTTLEIRKIALGFSGTQYTLSSPIVLTATGTGSVTGTVRSTNFASAPYVESGDLIKFTPGCIVAIIGGKEIELDSAQLSSDNYYMV